MAFAKPCHTHTNDLYLNINDINDFDLNDLKAPVHVSTAKICLENQVGTEWAHFFGASDTASPDPGQRKEAGVHAPTILFQGPVHIHSLRPLC